MKRTLIYRRWTPDLRGDFDSRVCSATTGEDGVDDFYSQTDGMVQIRMTDPDAPEYWVPAHEILALIINQEDE